MAATTQVRLLVRSGSRTELPRLLASQWWVNTCELTITAPPQLARLHPRVVWMLASNHGTPGTVLGRSKGAGTTGGGAVWCVRGVAPACGTRGGGGSRRPDGGSYAPITCSASGCIPDRIV